MSALSRAQREFALEVSCLIRYIYRKGYEVTFGDAYRDPRSHGEMGEFKAYGRRNSAHKQRLAVDLNLFKDGRYIGNLPTAKDHYRPFGIYWESRHPDHRWGGDFSNDDSNHFSRKFNGIA